MALLNGQVSLLSIYLTIFILFSLVTSLLNFIYIIFEFVQPSLLKHRVKSKMRFIIMFVAAVCFMFLIKFPTSCLQIPHIPDKPHLLKELHPFPQIKYGVTSKHDITSLLHSR